MVASASYDLSRNSLNEKSNVIASSILKIKRYARKSIYHGCMVWTKNPSLEINIRHRSASLVMPISDPRDRKTETDVSC